MPRGVPSGPSPSRSASIILACLAAACAPPEAQRVQGGGPGADIGNRSAVVEMHGGSRIFPDERCAVRGAACSGPLPASGRTDRISDRLSDHVLEPMGRGGRVRRVIYAPAPDLARPEPGERELPFPGPETGEAAPPREPVGSARDTASVRD